MPRKRLSPLLQKVSRLLKAPIFIARMRKSLNVQRLISLKKSRKMKKLMLKYGYIQEYQFSPSNSPLIQYYCRKPVKKRRYEDLFSIFFIGKCLGVMRADREYMGYPFELKVLPSIEKTVAREFSEICGADDDSIDERAEKFINRFYEEMRIQRQESLMH